MAGGAVFAVLVVVNLGLNIGLRPLLNGQPDRVEVHYTFAWMVVPGWVQVHGLDVRGTGRGDRWSIELPWASAWINPFALASRTFAAYRLRSSGGAFRYALRTDPEPNRPRSPRGPWTIELRGVEAHLDRIEVAGHALVGGANVAGSLSLADDVDASLVLDVLASTVLRDGHSIASGATGRVEVQLDGIPRLSPLGAEDAKRVDARVELDLHADDLSVLQIYLAKAPWLRLAGTADVRLDLEVAEGGLAPGSRGAATTHDLDLGFRAYSIRGDAELHLRVADEAGGVRTTASARYGRFDLGEGGRLPMVHGTGFEARVTAGAVELAKPFDDVEVALVLPSSTLQNLPEVARLLPADSGIEFFGGAGTVEGQLDASSASGHAVGELALGLTDVELGVDALRMIGDAAVHVVLTDGDLDRGIYPFRGTTVHIDRFGFDDEPARDWWARLTLDEGVGTVGASTYARGVFSLSAASSGPLLTVVIEKARLTSVAPWMQGLLEVRDLQGSGQLELRTDAILLRDLRLEGGSAELHLDLVRRGRANQGAMFARLGPLSIGVGFGGGDQVWHPFRARSWFAAHRVE